MGHNRWFGHRCGFVASFVFAAATSGSLFGEVLPIVNPSFEELSRPLAVGEQTNGAGGAGVPVATRFPFGGGGVSWANPVEVPGWRTFVRPPNDPATIRAGVLNPPNLVNGPFITGQDGTNVVALQVAQLGQSLNVLLQPNTEYRLSFLGGIGRMDSDYFLAVSLIAVDDLEVLPLDGRPGTQRLALENDFRPARETFGTMLPYEMVYTSPAVLPANLVNRYVGISLWGSDGFPRVVYDNFRLEATVVPEPSAVAGVLMVLGLLGRIRR